MKQLEIENQLREVVARMMTEVDLSTKQGRQDINLVSEDAWIPILKTVYQCPNLYNLNKKNKNFPGIDLGDDQERVAFQVTSSTDIEKVKKTLTQFMERGYKNSYDELYVFTITKKQKTYSQKSIDKITGSEFYFDAKKNIIDPSDVLEKVTSLRVGAQEKILNEFKVILGDIEERIAHIDEADSAPHILVSNLVQVDFPDNIYSAAVSLDEAAIIEDAKEQLDFKKKSASKRTLIKLALVMQGCNRNDWVYHEGKVFTFSNLETDSYFHKIVDIGTIESFESSYFYDSEFPEYVNIFKQLLKGSTRDLLKEKNVEWNRKEKTFYFLPNKEGDTVRKETWTGKKSATRTVYELKMQTKDPSKVAHHKHLSFDISFMEIDDKWHCLINPSWLFTFNLYTKSRFHEDMLSKLKRLEFNQSVRNIVRFIAFFLSNIKANSELSICFNELLEMECLYDEMSSEGDKGEQIREDEVEA